MGVRWCCGARKTRERLAGPQATSGERPRWARIRRRPPARPGRTPDRLESIPTPPGRAAFSAIQPTMSALSTRPSAKRSAISTAPAWCWPAPAAGKTRVITHKIAHLINECGIGAANIAAITFTNKAAKEMQERVAHIMGGRAGRAHGRTFHALGVRIIRQEAKHCGLKPQFSILDASDTVQIVSTSPATATRASPSRCSGRSRRGRTR